MSKLSSALIAAALFAMLQIIASRAGALDQIAKREMVDSTGAHVLLNAIPARIITLAPSLGELAADFSGENLERIVGVSDYSNYPPALAAVPSVGPYDHVNLERVASLKPDLVLATSDGNAPDQISHMRELGLPIVVVGTESLRSVETSMRMVAEAMGNTAAGNKMAEQLRTGLARFRERARGRTRLRVLLQVGADPLVVAGHDTFLNDLVEVFGAQNVYADLKARYPRPAVEDIVKRDPDVILLLALGSDEMSFDAAKAKWWTFKRLAATRAGKIIVLRSDAVVRPTPRLLEGLAELERAIYGP